MFNCSTGQFIAFVDSDDYIRSNYVNEIILNFKKHKDIDFIKFNFYFKNKFSVKKHINLLEKYEDQAYVFYKMIYENICYLRFEKRLGQVYIKKLF